ncbi:hypothetical protein Tsubulata_043828, partial [Turnera subulata]
MVVGGSGNGNGESNDDNNIGDGNNDDSIQIRPTMSSSRNATEEEEAAKENEFEASSSTSTSLLNSSSSSLLLPPRTPLHAIPDPAQSKPPETTSRVAARVSDTKKPDAGSTGVLLSSTTPRTLTRHAKSAAEPNSATSTPARTTTTAAVTSSRLSLGASSSSSTSSARINALSVMRGREGSSFGGGGGSSSRVSRGISVASYDFSEKEVPHFELQEDPSFWADHNVQVLIRIRPLNSMERAWQGQGRCLRQDSAHSLTWLGHPETRFTFDHVASQTIS